MTSPKPYKIDSLKLQQKIYKLHPENSHARKLMLKREQMLELNSLTLAKNLIFPDEQIVSIAAKLKNEALDSGLQAGFGLCLLGIGIFLPEVISLSSIIELSIFYSFFAVISIWTVLKLKQCIDRIKEIFAITRDSLKISNRISELTETLFKDL